MRRGRRGCSRSTPCPASPSSRCCPTPLARQGSRSTSCACAWSSTPWGGTGTTWGRPRYEAPPAHFRRPAAGVAQRPGAHGAAARPALDPLGKIGQAARRALGLARPGRRSGDARSGPARVVVVRSGAGCPRGRGHRLATHDAGPGRGSRRDLEQRLGGLHRRRLGAAAPARPGLDPDGDGPARAAGHGGDHGQRVGAGRRLPRRAVDEGLSSLQPGGRARSYAHKRRPARRPGSRRQRSARRRQADRRAAADGDGQHPARAAHAPRAGRRRFRLRLLRRPDADRETRVEGLLRPRADAGGVREPAQQAHGAEGHRGQEHGRLRLRRPAVRQRDEPVRTRRWLQVAPADAAVALARRDAYAAAREPVQVIVIAIVFAFLGVGLGLLSPVTIPITYARYTAVALLAALDSIFGAFKAYIAGTFEARVFYSGLLTNALLAGGLTYLGDKLGVDLSIPALVAFGVRIFNNLGATRRNYL